MKREMDINYEGCNCRMLGLMNTGLVVTAMVLETMIRVVMAPLVLEVKLLDRFDQRFGVKEGRII